MPQPIIVIGRSFGAGGRAIGRHLAEMLNIPFYDNELLKEAAGQFGFPREVFARADEKRPSVFKRFVSQAYGLQENYTIDGFSFERLYEAQSLVIRSIASRGGCVIIGRTADYILRDFENLVSVFVHAPIAFRARKIMERGDAEDEVAAIELAKAKDKRRHDYYNYFTGRHWGSADNYDLTLDSSLLPAAESAEIIALFLKKSLKNYSKN